SFPVRRVARFRSLTLSDRRATGAADSLLRAGNDASGPRGVGVAMPLWRESLRRFEALADTAGIARVLLAMGGGLADAQEYDSAAAHFARSRDLAEKIGDLGVQATALGNLGTLRAMRGDLDGAVEWYARAKPIRQRIGDLGDRKSTRLNSSHVSISYAVFCLKKKKKQPTPLPLLPP